MKNKILFKELLAIGLLLTLVMGCTVPASPSEPTPTLPAPTVTVATKTTTLTQTLTKDAYQYDMECSGEGSTTVLLLGGRAAIWEPIRAEINRSARTCVFEHMGNRSTPLTAKEIAKNVHTLLNDAKVEGSYVVVGFSVGGYIARLFADLYPDEVSGMALLDSSHEDQNARLLAALPAETSEECQELKDYRRELQGSHILPIGTEIRLDFDVSAAEVHDIEKQFGNLPLVVLTAGRSDWPACFPAEVREQLDKTWLDLQEELAGLSTNSNHLVATESDHSFSEQPEMVIDAIQQAAQAAQTVTVP